MHAAQPDHTRWRQEFPSLTRCVADAAAAAPMMRELAGVADQWERSFVVVDGAFRAAFPDAVHVTPHRAAVAATSA